MWMQIIRRQFLFQSSDFSCHEYEIRFCKELYIPPYPQNLVLLEIMYTIRGSYAA